MTSNVFALIYRKCIGSGLGRRNLALLNADNIANLTNMTSLKHFKCDSKIATADFNYWSKHTGVKSTDVIAETYAYIKQRSGKYVRTRITILQLQPQE